MPIRPHSYEWYRRLAKLHRGYYYPWQSILPPYNGEDVYLEMLHSHLHPELDVLDAGCGHGELTLQIAAGCQHVLGYDRIPEYIQLAQQAAQEQAVTNVAFVCADSSPEANQGQARIPAGSGSFDLLVSRRGPINWIEDARRVARPGAILLQLNPWNPILPSWNDELPEVFRIPPPNSWTIRDSVCNNLAKGGLRLHSSWLFEVPEMFPDPQQLYIRLSWGFTPEEVPTFEQVRPTLEGIFARHAGTQGLALPFARFLWKSIVE